MITATQKLAAHQFAATDRSFAIVTSDHRRRIVDATIAAFERCLASTPSAVEPAMRAEINQKIKQQVREEPKGALPALLTILLGFLINKLLEWLWNQLHPD